MLECDTVCYVGVDVYLDVYLARCTPLMTYTHTSEYMEVDVALRDSRHEGWYRCLSRYLSYFGIRDTYVSRHWGRQITRDIYHICHIIDMIDICCEVLEYTMHTTNVALLCVAACCSVLECVAVCWSVLHCVAVRCSMLQCVAVCCSVSQRVAVYCSVL